MRQQKNIKILDANIILRFLMRDNREMADQADVLVTLEVAAEVVFVMLKVYGLDRCQISKTLIDFSQLNNIQISEYSVYKKALELFGDNCLDFVDCLLCAYHRIYGYDICTFDKKLQKLIAKPDK